MRSSHLFLLLMVGVSSLFAQDHFECIIESVDVFDGDTILLDQNIGINRGKTYFLDKMASADTVMNGSGFTLMPGLINAHAHLWFPGNLQQGLQAGVVATLDMHTGSFGMKNMQLFKDSLSYGHYFTAGSGATVEKGHGTQYGIPVPVIGDSLNPTAFVDEQVALGADYIKILREPSRPTVSYEEIDLVVNRAHHHHKKAVAHVSKKMDGIHLSQLGVDGLVHIWADSMASPEELINLKNADMFVIPTLIVLERVTEYYREKNITGRMMPMDSILKQTKTAFDLGIPILAGTDAPNFGLNYDKDMYLELYLLGKAGLPNLEILKSATSRTADAFGLESLGRIKNDAMANCILLKGDPIQHLEHIENVAAVWNKGKKISLK